MNYLITILVLITICSVVNGSAICAASVTAFPPDPTTHCCGFNSLSTTKIYRRPSQVLLEDYPWVALIEYVKDEKVNTLCGGTLISGKYVLTAAHCVVGLSTVDLGKPKNIRLGEYDTSNEGPDCMEIEADFRDCSEGAIRIPIEKIIPHPEYQAYTLPRINDIALIRMTQMAPYTDFIRPICLPSVDITKHTGDMYLTKAAWGTIDGNTRHPIIQSLTPEFVPLDKCKEIYSAYDQNVTSWEGNICAGGGNIKDFCRAHGGFPLMLHNVTTEIVGIVNLGLLKCSTNIPTIYVNVYEYNSWIKSNIVA